MQHDKGKIIGALEAMRAMRGGAKPQARASGLAGPPQAGAGLGGLIQQISDLFDQIEEQAPDKADEIADLRARTQALASAAPSSQEEAGFSEETLGGAL